ncbi:MAG TPA: helix-turn-helix domain-containing protein [Aggregatilinea sp.]|jgi:AcrR family transcriptional regulator|uniref:TetR/AcrR family transcriptional regulator n=1 Tax=Aggregatilinea sp. TaxID=2806333 RepID=UPI002BC2491D|nr:helix-turn-helix domain-containing protein [Aggregatilinea sp.]HML24576.1 helix-turn-helix domain-containing protein [Aggregatilinea sp.]
MENVNKPLTHRQRQALATQQLIVDAARDLFLDQGYVATTIEAISARAGVGVSTVYAIFGNKRGILRAIRQAWHSESGQREIYAQAAQQPDPARRLEMAAHATRRQWEASAALIAVYHSAAAADPEAAAELAEALGGRRANLSRFVAGMAPHLHPDLDPERAADIFLALTRAEVYQELVGTAAWSDDEYEHWLAGVLKQQLLP